MPTIDEYQRLVTQIEQLEENRNKVMAAYEIHMEHLLQDFGLKSIDDANATLEELNSNLEDLDDAIERETAEIKKRVEAVRIRVRGIPE